jgi:MFS family permease
VRRCAKICGAVKPLAVIASRVDSGVLRYREFRLLLLGRTISLVGDTFNTIALAFAVLEVTGSKAALGFVLAAKSLPQVVFMLFGGVWADRLPRNRVMVISNCASGTTQAAIAMLLFTGHAQLWNLVPLAGLNGVSWSFFYPASSGIVPQIVPRSALQVANATLRLGVNASQIGGLLIGGAVIAVTSPSVGIAVDSISFFISATLIAAMRLPSGLRVEGSDVVQELRAGWREFRSRSWLWSIVARDGLINAVGASALKVLGPAVALESYGGAAGWAVIPAGTSVGLIVGGFVMLRSRPTRTLVVGTLALLLTFPVLCGLAFALPLPLIVVLAVVSGFGSEVYAVLWDTTLQQQIPQEILSRVSSYDAVGSWPLMSLGFTVIGPLAVAFGTRATLLGAAVFCTCVTLCVLLVRDVRRIRRLDGYADEDRTAEAVAGAPAGDAALDKAPVREIAR